ncbi:MAG TPA: sialate O-acetylesterase [Chthoniobacteraceae bacterium]|jgi:sialate O-acetylesterase|nr:sialate O-acetylesterase [Chthoniobacteraceae bacterium]
MKKILLAALLPAFVLTAHAELKLPAIVGNHMVLQQKQADPIWGWDTPGTKITVTYAGQTKTAEAGADGKWTVSLDAGPANDKPATISIQGTTKVELNDVLVGEVWICSGQSNMGFTLKGDWNGDIEAAASKLPNLRLITVPNLGTQEPQNDFKGEWKASDPDTASSFSAVGFLFGRYLHEILQIPVGLINDSWGGSAAEAWVRRESLEKDDRFKLLMENTRKNEATMADPVAKAKYEEQLAKWKTLADEAKAANKPAPRPPNSPDAWLHGNARPGNIFNGVVLPTKPYGIKGIVWYQGESNASRALEYADLFPFMIEQWRKEWNQGEFPFYWVQLADFLPERPEPGDSTWAELRESQTKTQKLANTGQAVIIDLGEGKDIHPKNKHDVAARLVRWALVKDYGMKIPFHSPEFKSVEFFGKMARVELDCFGRTLRPFDTQEVTGFAVCGEDHVWQWAKGKLNGTTKVEVTSDKVEKPIAVRYAWADNPVCNLFSEDGLPVTPFRTDDFPMITAPKPPVAANAVPNPGPAQVAPAAVKAPVKPAPDGGIPLPPPAK